MPQDEDCQTDSLKRKCPDEPELRSPGRSKRAALRVDIPARPNDEEDYSPSSLFSASSCSSAGNSTAEQESVQTTKLARLKPPPIPGLFFDPTLLLSETIAENVFNYCLKTYFSSPEVDQVMLFERAPGSESESSDAISTTTSPGGSGIPPPLTSLLSDLSSLLHSSLPPDVHYLLFPKVPSRARQAIINLYTPGEGITPHVDLLGRFGDGIVGVSFAGGCVMQFARQDAQTGSEPPEEHAYDVYLPERSVYVMTGESRYEWTHGIPRRTRDYVETQNESGFKGGTWIDRKVRLSITFRWLLPGAEIVGDGEGNGGEDQEEN